MATKHEKTVVDFDKPYEENEVGMKGIVWFGVGLFLLIVVTFGLMWALLLVMEDNAKQTIDTKNPLARTDEEKLPPGPRLQGAPGFSVAAPVEADGQKGPINLELKDPRSEYWELTRQWKDEWQNGRKVRNADGTIGQLTLPIADAKKMLLTQAPAARAKPEAEKALDEARTILAGSSSGRTRSDRRR